MLILILPSNLTCEEKDQGFDETSDLAIKLRRQSLGPTNVSSNGRLGRLLVIDTSLLLLSDREKFLYHGRLTSHLSMTVGCRYSEGSVLCTLRLNTAY